MSIPFPNGPPLSLPMYQPSQHHPTTHAPSHHTLVYSTPHPSSSPTQAAHFTPRPNPHIFSSMLYINAVPPDMPEVNLAEALRECMPVRINLNHPVGENERLLPDQMYDWMSRTGTLEFQTMKDVEKAMAILPEHPLLLTQAAYISPYPPPAPLPYPNPPSSPRYIRPTNLIQPPNIPPSSTDAEIFMAKCPTPGELHDALRVWGSLRGVSVWVEEGDSEVGGGAGLRWRAKAEFWYEDEARQFEVGWGQTGSLLKGWQLAIIVGNPEPIIPPSLLTPPSIPPTVPNAPQMPPTPTSFRPIASNPPKHFTPDQLQTFMGLNYIPPYPQTPATPFEPRHHSQSQVPPHPAVNTNVITANNLPTIPGFGMNISQIPPLTPQSANFPTPWASHNPFASIPPHTPTIQTPTEGIMQYQQSLPFSLPSPLKNQFPRKSSISQSYDNTNTKVKKRASFSGQGHPSGSQFNVGTHGGIGLDFGALGLGGGVGYNSGRRFSTTTVSSASTVGRQRTWSVSVGEAPDGSVRPLGYVANDGTVIQHGPGQHIRPAPLFGPGSTSASGLVDLSNVFVKNLDPDISSFYLSEIFANLGKVVSARVMRDEHGCSRGYGFVSFVTPEEAAHAISMMNGAKIGNQNISVTLHEPRKLRPEKMAERAAQGLPVMISPRRSRGTSPIRFDRGALGRRREVMAREPPPAATDAIRLLSPPSRKLALAKRLEPTVQAVLSSLGQVAKVGDTIDGLVRDDLGLIPLLHDKEGLESKILEIAGSLDGRKGVEEAEEEAEGGIISAERVGRLRAMVQALELVRSAPVKGTDEVSDASEHQGNGEGEESDSKGRRGEAILGLLIGSLPSAEITRCLTDEAVLKRNYELAKTVLENRQERGKDRVQGSREETDWMMTHDDMRSDEVEMEHADMVVDEVGDRDNEEGKNVLGSPTSSGRPSSSTDLTSHPSTHTSPLPESKSKPLTESASSIQQLTTHQTTTSQLHLQVPSPPQPPIDASQISIPYLSSLSASQIIATIKQLDPETFHDQLGIPRLSALEIGGLVRFSEKVGKLDGVEKRSEVVRRVAERVDMTDLKRTKKLMIIKEMLNKENDDENFCELLRYPALLEGKIRDFIAGNAGVTTSLHSGEVVK